MLNRREMILGLAASSALVPGESFAQSATVDRKTAISSALLRKDTLAQSAARLGILFGTAAEPNVLADDDAYAQTVARECSILVPENSLKPTTTRAKADGFDFSRADRLLAFATSHGMAFRGHTLVWYAGVPSWQKTAVTSFEKAQAELTLDIDEPCGHFRGRIDSWDVVNEALKIGSPNALRDSLWLQTLGPDYIADAFTAAHQADPNALLVYNDYGIESDLPYQQQKRSAVLGLLKNLKRHNVPIDALGIQAHLSDPTALPFNPVVFDRFLSDVQDLGLKILITELDVTDKNLPADIGTRDSIVAHVMSDFLKVVLRQPGVITLNVWGLSDRHTWITHLAPRTDGLPVRSTLFDQNMNKKAAYWAVKAALDDAANRR